MPFSWSMQLKQALSSPASRRKPRIAIVGIGSEFNADDCAGPFVARKLSRPFEKCEDVLVMDAGTAPENVTGALRKFAPDWVILIDAVDLGRPPGTVEWLALDAVEGMDAFTHGLPPAVFSKFLVTELNCRVGLIGIQPNSLTFDQPASAAVTASIRKVAAGIRRVLNSLDESQ